MSRQDEFDRADFDRRYPSTPREPTAPSAATPTPIWPVDRPVIGQSVMRDRNGAGRPHKGVDLFVPAGSPVRAVRSGRVLRVVDGRDSADPGRRAAGLFVDIAARDGRIYRYLHLGSASVTAKQRVNAGGRIGTVAEPFTSGLAERPHLHLEIRAADWKNGDYGRPIDPLSVLGREPHG